MCAVSNRAVMSSGVFFMQLIKTLPIKRDTKIEYALTTVRNLRNFDDVAADLTIALSALDTLCQEKEEHAAAMFRMRGRPVRHQFIRTTKSGNQVINQISISAVKR